MASHRPSSRFRKHRPLFASTQKKQAEKNVSNEKQQRWVILPFLWRSLKRVCIILGAFTLFTMLLGLFSTATLFTPKIKPLPNEMVLFLQLDGDLPEQRESAGFSDPFAFTQTGLYDFITALDNASADDRIKGIYARLNETAGYSLGQIQELRAAVKRFRESGKFTHIYGTGYGAGGGIGQYYLASAFEDIWLQPIGVVSITGMSAQIPFFRDTLDRLGIEPQFLQRKEYKSAYESVMRDDISPENREMMTALIADIRQQIVTDVSADRNITPQQFSKLVDGGMYPAPSAEKSGLINTSGYADVLVADISEKVTGEREDHLDIFVPIETYIKSTRKSVKHHTKTPAVAVKGQDIEGVADTSNLPESSLSPKTELTAENTVEVDQVTEKTVSKNKEPTSPEIKEGTIEKYDPREDSQAHKSTRIALIYVDGAIMPSAVNSQISTASLSLAPAAALGQNVAAADEIAPALLAAADDDDIGAVVLRIDSPGGSPTASESILRAVQKVQEEGKPVIVSMGTAAASGGYWIASLADYIFTQPGTLTGSIGVIGGKLSLQDMWKKLGVNWAEIEWGTNAGLWSFNEPFSASEKARYDMILDHIYSAFIERVAKGRHMNKQQVELIAKGRVWSGSRAIEIGLADELGGLYDALNYTAKQVGAKNYRQLDVVTLPKPKSTIEELMELLGESGQVMSNVKDITTVIKPFTNTMGHTNIWGSSQPAVYENIRIE